MAADRASDHDRERVAAVLRASWVAGAVSTGTFESRLGLALRANGQAQLRALTHDLPRRVHPVKQFLLGLFEPRRRAAEPALVLRVSSVAAEVDLGRHRSCARVYDDDSVSRSHALIRREPNGLRLYDLASTNGTWHNGFRVRESVRLADGDEIRLGRVRLIVRLD